MIVGALRLPVVIEGMTELSTTRRPETPITRSSGSTTASGSSMAPMRAVHEGCSALSSRSRNEGVDLFVRHAIRAGLDFAAAERGEGRLLEDFA
jgi:hypothetical protein